MGHSKVTKPAVEVKKTLSEIAKSVKGKDLFPEKLEYAKKSLENIRVIS